MGTISIIIPDLGNGLSGFNRGFERFSKRIDFASSTSDFDEKIQPEDNKIRRWTEEDYLLRYNF